MCMDLCQCYYNEPSTITVEIFAMTTLNLTCKVFRWSTRAHRSSEGSDEALSKPSVVKIVRVRLRHQVRLWPSSKTKFLNIVFSCNPENVFHRQFGHFLSRTIVPDLGPKERSVAKQEAKLVFRQSICGLVGQVTAKFWWVIPFQTNDYPLISTVMFFFAVTENVSLLFSGSRISLPSNCGAIVQKLLWDFLHRTTWSQVGRSTLMHHY